METQFTVSGSDVQFKETQNANVSKMGFCWQSVAMSIL
jgi:hypothetical protein